MTQADATSSRGPQRVQLIGNPTAGSHSDPHEQLAQVVHCLSEQGLAVEVVLTQPDEKPTVMAARAAADEGYDIVAAVGGDGTIEAVARGLVGSSARLGIIPSGTANNIAKSLGIPHELSEACALFSSGYERRIDVGQIATSAGDAHYFFEMASIGLAASLFPDLQDVHKGVWQDLPKAAVTLLNYPTPRVTLTLDDLPPITVDTLAVTVANMPAFGLTFLVAPGARVEDGRLDVCVYPGYTKADLMSYFATVARGGRTDNTRLQRYRARRVVIESDPPLEAIADGRAVDTGSYTISLLPAALRVITPRETGLSGDPPARPEQKVTQS